MALESHFEETQVFADGLLVGQDCFSLRLIAHFPMLGVAHRLLEVVPHIAHAEQSPVNDHAAIDCISGFAHEFLFLFLLQALNRFSGEYRIRLSAFLCIKETLAIPSLKLYGVSSFFCLLGHHDDVCNHLLHAPCGAVAIHAYVAYYMVLCVVVRKLFL